MLALKRNTHLIIFLLFLFLIVFNFLPACHHIQRNSSHPEISDESISKGKKLAAQYCQSCHMLPNPSLLDSKTWEKGVLPHMGPRLGIFEFFYQRYPNNRYDRFLPKDFYPSPPVVSEEQWRHILDYYIATSPDSLPPQTYMPIANASSVFNVQLPSYNYHSPAVSYIKIDTTNGERKIILADITKQALFRFDQQLRLTDSLQWSGRVVDIAYQKNALVTCDIGGFMPTNEKLGKLRYVPIQNNKLQQDSILFTPLARPVQLTAADLNSDEKTDYIVCEFGYLTGALSWMEDKGNGQYERHVLRPLPGAVKTYIQDADEDGRPDIWALMAQGEEGIFLYTNKGGGQFSEKQVLRFPPSYGSSSFELVDFNKDGHLDIIYTCGDNADYSTILKPYHGVYIFFNDGHNRFSQKYFYHINGCYKAIANDFDNDGDLDIAAIAYFADYINRPQEGFIYLENKGDFNFTPYSIAQTQSGRWMTMDAGDIDDDGKTDIVLGNFSAGPTMFKSHPDWESGPPFMVLKNVGTIRTK